MRLKDPPLLCGAVMTSALVVIAGRLGGMPELSWVFPTLTIGLILWSAWLRGRLANHYAQFVTLGLAVSLFADLLRLTGDQVLLGTSLLMLACLSYLRAFAAEMPLRLSGWPMLLALGLAAALLASIWKLLPPGTQAPILITVLLLALTTGQAASRVSAAAAGNKRSALLALIGAIMFAFSIGLFIADTVFHALPLATLWILSAYWLGQTLIALSIPLHTSLRSVID